MPPAHLRIARLLLIRLLLVALLFNTAIGVPAHAIAHLHEAEVGAPASGEPAEHGESHASCAWCASLAQQADALGMRTAHGNVPAARAGQPAPWHASTAPGPAARWPFGSRDPPLA